MEVQKKGTTTIGLVCKDGVVIAADRRATAGNLIVDKRAKKVNILTEDIAVTIAGSVSDAQFIMKLLKAEVQLKTVRTNKKPSMKEVANMLGSMLYSNIRQPSMLPGIAHFILAGRDKEGVHLYDLFPDGSITEIPDFVGSGSGSVMAYGLLEARYDQNMTCEQAIPLAVQAINVALQRDAFSGNGVDVVKVTESGVEKVYEQALLAEVKK